MAEDQPAPRTSSSTSTKTPSTSTSSTTRKPLKVQPKNAGRRSEAERKRIEKEEAERRKARLDAAAADAAAEEERRRAAYGYMSDSRGRGGRGGFGRGEFRGGRGGRGGFMGGRGGRGGMGRDGGGGRGGFGRYDGSARVKEEGQTDIEGDIKMDGGLASVKREGGYVSSSEDEERQEGRRNIEYINLTSDEEEDSKERVMHVSGGLMPVRLKRTKHVDRVIGINTEASSATAAKIAKRVEARMEEGGAKSLEEAMTATTKQGKARAKDVEIVGGARKWKGVYDDKDASSAEVRIKEEPREDDVTMLDVPDADTAETTQANSAAVSDEDVKPVVRKAAKPRRKSGLRGFRGKGNPAFQTEEERREWEIQQRDLEVLQDELGRVNIATTKPGQTENGESSATAEGEAAEQAESKDQRADNVYIFQLPPILPGLKAAKHRVKWDSPEMRKAEVVEQTEEDSKPIQVDSDVEEERRRSEARETAIKPKLEAGKAGKLRVYKSGRVTLDWGGTSLEVTMGLDAYFLQTAVLTKIAEQKEEGDEFGGEAMSFGQVRGKFVVTPDWEEILN